MKKIWNKFVLMFNWPAVGLLIFLAVVVYLAIHGVI